MDNNNVWINVCCVLIILFTLSLLVLVNIKRSINSTFYFTEIKNTIIFILVLLLQNGKTSAYLLVQCKHYAVLW